MTDLECAEDTDTDLAGLAVEADHLVGVHLTLYVLLYIRVYVTVRLGHLKHNTVLIYITNILQFCPCSVLGLKSQKYI